MFRLDGQVALVTGGASGIGAATVRALSRAGATVAIIDRNPAPTTLGHSLSQQADLTDSAALSGALENACRSLGAPDIVVAAAGAALDEGSDWTDLNVLDTMYELHVRGVQQLAHLTVPAMAEKGHGSFIVISSIAGLRGNALIDRYGMTKAASAQIARNLAVQWGPRGVRANAISPGVIETPFSGAITDDPEIAARRKDMTPLRRFGTPDEVAGTVVWLASPAGGFVTGQNIVVDGGTLIGS